MAFIIGDPLGPVGDLLGPFGKPPGPFGELLGPFANLVLKYSKIYVGWVRWFGRHGLYQKLSPSVSLSRVIAVQSEVVGQVGPDSLQLSLSLI